MQNSAEYHAERLLKALPAHYLHEYALLLSRLGRHEEVRERVRDLAQPWVDLTAMSDNSTIMSHM